MSHCFPSGNSPPKYARINEHLNQSSTPSNNDEKRQDGKIICTPATPGARLDRVVEGRGPDPLDGPPLTLIQRVGRGRRPSLGSGHKPLGQAASFAGKSYSDT
jgi:hypothetical protein